MFENQRVCALLLMAGSGYRFGDDVPKQFQLLSAKEVFRYALETMVDSNFFEEIVLVTHPEWMDIADLPEYVKVVPGGKTRQESSFIGLQSVTEIPDIVLIHEAARPFVTEEILRQNILGALKYGAVDTCIPTADTLNLSNDGKEVQSIPSRKTFFRGQTPQTFSYDVILEAHKKALQDGIEDASDDCQLALRFGKKVYIIPGSEDNLKITSEFDLKIAEVFIHPLLLPK